MAMLDLYGLQNAARLGYRLFPIDGQTKNALIDNPMQNATSDPKVISDWFKRHPGAVWGNFNPQASTTATPFTWLDPAKIPPREWLYGEHYVRRYLSATLATGGVGKSSLSVVEALAMVSGKPLLGTAPKERLRTKSSER